MTKRLTRLRLDTSDPTVTVIVLTWEEGAETIEALELAGGAYVQTTRPGVDASEERILVKPGESLEALIGIYSGMIYDPDRTDRTTP